MKTGMSLQAMAAQLETSVATRKDYIAPQGKIEAQVTDSKAIVLAGFNGDTYAIKPYAHKQMADVLGIPARYYDRMQAEQPELLASNINTWLKADPENKRMVRTLDGAVRAVLSPRYRPLDNFDLAQAVLPKLMQLGVQVVSADLTETRMYIKCILPGLSDTLPDGMVWGSGHNAIAEYGGNSAGRLVAALVVSNSEVGAGTLRVEPSVFTTWCTNLAIMKAASMKKYHVGRSGEATDNWELFRDETRQADDRAFFMKVADITERAFDPKMFALAVDEVRRATTDKIEGKDLPKVVESAIKVLALPPATSGSILTYLAQGGDLSRWGLASAVTATANGLEDYEQATAFERAGGEVLAMSASAWKEVSAAA
jgi:hypothetical protein